MFDCEAAFHAHRKKHGQKEAIEYLADINRYTLLRAPTERAKDKSVSPALDWARTLFDYNEHFIELSNMGEEDRSLMFMLAIAVLTLFALPIMGLALTLPGEPLFTHDWNVSIIAGGGLLGFVLTFVYFLWPTQFAPNYFTYLRARYRFNRSTRKVYVLRPKRYGGNVILDWDRVKAHVNWCAPRDMTPDQIDDKFARQRRQETAGGQFGMRGLVLYWPPLDPADHERRGEEVLWVGPKLAGEGLWQYIRTFMEEGIDKVPAPTEYEWLRKGFHTPSQHLEETELSASRVLDRVGGRGENSAQTQLTFLATFLWAPLHCLAERLCTWPTFPKEWNSDSGRKRREDGIGPEEPLRWKASPERTVDERPEPKHV